MKKKKIRWMRKFVCLLLSLFAVAAVSCAKERITGNGEIVKLEKSVAPFNSFKISGSGTIKVHKSEESKVVINVDSNLATYITVKSRNKKLDIKTEPHQYTKLMIDIYTPNVNTFRTTGSSAISFAGNVFDSVKPLRIEINGSGKFDSAAFPVETAEINITGSGSVNTWCNEKLTVKVTGAGEIYYKGDPMISKSIFGSAKIEKL
ncbi:MAG: DUF2807 domain-containing protein [Spirochaetaceae bacterium]|jgi:hypothetical protein|nr:DUF2807 domain-containing protein [Spirochaetaceae bacterium]